MRKNKCWLAALGLLLALVSTAQAQRFGAVTTYSSGGSTPEYAIAGDLNGDGRPDIVTSNNSTSTGSVLGVLLQRANGSFAPVATYPSGGSTPYQIALGDVNGDNQLDVVVVNLQSDNVGVLLGTGTGTLGKATLYALPLGAGPIGLSLADMNRDGWLDIVTGNSYFNGGDGITNGSVSILLNSGSGTFGAATTYVTGGSLRELALADFNKDGVLDIAAVSANTASNSTGTKLLYVLLSRSGGYAPVATYAVGSSPTVLTTGDLNRDGQPDLVFNRIREGNIGVLLGRPGGTFSAMTTYTAGGTFVTGVELGDVNGDNLLDAVVGNYYGKGVDMLLGTGTGAFGTATSFVTGGNPYGISLADVSGDGKLDILAANIEGNTVGVLLNTDVAPTLTALSPASGPVGTSVTLTGTSLTGATAVRFNGTVATTFSVVSATTITATVPAGATSGNVTVTTPSGTSNGLAFTVTMPVTSTPVLTQPADGSFTNTDRPEYRGTAPAFSAISIYRAPAGGSAVLTDTTFANSRGNFHRYSYDPLADGAYAVYVKATASGQATSANSNTNTFTVYTQRPSVAISSAAGASGSTTSASPLPFTVTFSEGVTGFIANDLTVRNGTVSGFAGSGTTYTFNITPTTAGTATTVNVPANVAQNRAGSGNTAAPAAYALTLVAPTIEVFPNSMTPGTQGVAYSRTLSALGGTAPYTYAITSGVLPAGLSLSGNSISGTPTVFGTFSFAVTATDATAAPGPYSGTRTYSLVIAAATSTTWTGASSTDWFTAGNWTNGVPTTNTDAIIPGGLATYPVLTAGTASTRSFTIRFAGQLIQTGGTLDVRGDLTNDGRYAPAGGTVSLGQTTRASIAGNNSLRFWNLDVQANGVVMSTLAEVQVRQVLTLSGDFITNGTSFKLESNATGTALVVNNGGVVVGNVTVQRYLDPSLNPGLGYRHFSAPISTATVGSLATASFSPVVNPAYNASAQPGTVTPFPTVYGYDQGRLATATNNLAAFDKGWFSPAALSDALTVGRGYTVNISAGQTLSLTGPLNNGDVAQSLTRSADATAPDAGWQLLGNPYPAPLDYALVAAADRPGLDAAIYVFQSSSQYGGSYQATVNGVGGSAGAVLAQGQGFFVRVSSGQASGTLTLRNAHRLAAYASPAYTRVAEVRPLVRLDLQSAAGTDPLYVYFEPSATAGLDRELDAVKLPNTTGLNLSAEAGAHRLAIDALPVLGTTELVVPLAVGVPAPGSFSLRAAQLLNLAATPVYLRDRQTGAVIDLRQQPAYQFTVADASALLTNRFELVFSPRQALATAPPALAQQVALYPNPAGQAAFVELPASLGRQAVLASLVDALGRPVRTMSLPAQGALAHRLDLSGLATGIYALRLRTSAGLVVRKLIIE